MSADQSKTALDVTRHGIRDEIRGLLSEIKDIMTIYFSQTLPLFFLKS